MSNFRHFILLLVFLCVAMLSVFADPPREACSVYRLDEQGRLKKCKLKEPGEVQGYPCQRWLHFFPDGKLKKFQLAEDHDIQGVAIPKDSTVFLRPNGTLKDCWFSKNVRIQGVPVEGGFMKVSTGFHPNGRLRYVFLSEDAEIQGVPCKSDWLKQKIVTFHTSGTLKSATLSRDFSWKGHKFEKGTELHFTPEGKIFTKEEE